MSATHTNPAIKLKPKEAARMAAIGEDPEFGRLLAIGKPARWMLLVPMILGAFFAVPGVIFTVSMIINSIRGANAGFPNVPGLVWMGPAQLGIGLALAVPALVAFRRRSVEYRFFEHGMLRWWKKREPQRLAYLDVTAMTYALVRQNYHGVYIGTSGRIRFDVDPGVGRTNVKYSFAHREKAKGLINRRFEGLDPMDFVRDAVAEAVSERLAMEIAEKGSAPWTGAARFTKQGLEVKKMIGGAKVLPYETIDRMAAQGGGVTFFQAGEKSGAVTLMTNSRNFWPGFVLFRTLVTPRATAEDASLDPEEFADED